MKALILTAGFGNRMRPLTNDMHKTLLKVNGQTIIDRIVAGLIHNGVTDIVLSTGYMAEQLVAHLQANYPEVSFQFAHNPRYKETNNIYSLALAFEQIEIDDDMLIIESDLIFEEDVIATAIHSPHKNVALVSPYVIGLDGTVVQISGDKIVNIFPPHLQDVDFNLFDKYKTLNIYKFSKDFSRNTFSKLLMYYAKTINDNCYYELILGILIYMQQEVIHCEVIDPGSWAEVDDPNDLNGAEFIFNKKARLDILESEFGGYWNHNILDFCFIRNMYFPTESMLSEIRNNLPALLTNYGSKQSILNRKLSYVLQCREDRVLALNGASQIYPLLENILTGKSALVPTPTFGEYPRIFPNAITYSDGPGIDMAKVEQQLETTDIAVFVNPNNPTGTTLPTDWLISMARKFADVLFVIDESFIEFTNISSIVETLEVDPMTNILVIKSMSKSYGVPGMRLGNIYTCDRDMLAVLASQIPIWNLNSITEFYLEILLKNKNPLQKSFEPTISDRILFAKELETLTCVEEVYSSGADFILVRMPSEPIVQSLAEKLLVDDSIYIKDVTDKFNDDANCYFRFAVRLPEENSRLVDSIKKLMHAI